MTSFVHANLGSDSDSDDADFDPSKETGHVDASEEEQSGDEDGKNKSGRKKAKNKKSSIDRSVGCFQDLNEDNESDAIKKEFEEEKEKLKQLADEQKTEDLWSDFKKDVGPAKKKPAKSGGGLGSFTSMSKLSTKKGTNKAKTKNPRTKNTPSSISSIFDNIGNDCDDITSQTPPGEAQRPPSLMSSIFETVKKQGSGKPEAESDTKVDENKMKITQVFDFAGEAVEVTKEVDKDSKEAKQFFKAQEKTADAQKRPAGLNSIMGVISGKKPKMGTLDKSKMDWNKFVDEEGIKEELQTHNKGKEGYVEKQMFLERSDYRRFEIEREAREKSRKTLNK